MKSTLYLVKATLSFLFCLFRENKSLKLYTMKKINALIISVTIVLIALIWQSCDDRNSQEDEYPRFVSAKVTNEARNEVIVSFNKSIYSDEAGFIIKVDGEEAVI